jgi:hypothetical protein
VEDQWKDSFEQEVEIRALKIINDEKRGGTCRKHFNAQISISLKYGPRLE